MRWIAARHLGTLLLAVVVATGLAVIPAGATEVRAATPDLTIVTTARYDVQPDQRRVRVTLDMVLTNHLRDTTTRRFYFDKAILSVLPGTSGFKVSWAGSGTPTVRPTRQTKDYTLLQVNLAQRLYSGTSATYRLRFDLVDKGGSATRDIRIGTALVSFPVWAFATDSTPGSTVKVVFPKGFQAEVQAGEIPAPTTGADGRLIFQTGKLSKPLDFFAFLVADRPGAYAEKTITATVGDDDVVLTIRGWPDDSAWTKRVGGLVAKALPRLSDRIGLPWPRDDGLVIQEAVSRSTGGYAGLFDPSEGHVEVAYFADASVVLHESAHAWFNGALLADRWANEGFASYYGLEVAKDLKVKATAEGLTPELEKARIPLNAWGPVGREESDTEDFAYAATLELARAIADRAGEDGLREVWADASDRIGAYQPPGSVDESASGVGGTLGDPETVEGPPDWRGFLDLLEAHSSESFVDLWRTWVVRPQDEPLLTDRAAARSRYDEVLAEAADWRLPKAIRDAMRAWQFDQATALLDDASEVLVQRDAIATAAVTAGLTAPDTLERAFEEEDGFTTATQEAAAELQTIDRYTEAVAARPIAPDLFQTLGLWGTVPEADLDLARAKFAEGDLDGASAAADSAASVWTTATDVGRGRAISLVALTLAILLAIGILFAVWHRGRRPRRRSGLVSMAHPYATLAATSDPLEAAQPGDGADTGAGPD